MSDEPHPPQRPRRVALDTRLAVAALTILAINLGWWVYIIESTMNGQAPQWLRELFSPEQVTVRLLYYGPTTAVFLLLAASLIVRSRRR